MTKDNDRFGMPDSAFTAAREAHGLNSPVIRNGMYVPLRREIRELSADELRCILIDWMWESPSELIPDNEQISAVREILLERHDANSEAIQGLIADCDDYLNI